MTALAPKAGYGEAGAYERLVMALRYAGEAARKRFPISLTRALQTSQEAATELGMHLSDGRWLEMSSQLQVMQLNLTELNMRPQPAAVWGCVADVLEAVLVQVRAMRQRRAIS